MNILDSLTLSPINWVGTHEGLYVFQATVQGKSLGCRLNHSLAEPICTLVVENESIAVHEIPEIWKFHRYGEVPNVQEAAAESM
jgi:hypothetical protein